MKRTNLLLSILILLFLSGNIYSQSKKNVSIEDIWLNYRFYPDMARGTTPLNDDQHYAMLDNGMFIEKYEYKSGKNVGTILCSSEAINPETGKSIGKFDNFQFSNDESKILIATDENAIYRRSALATYWVYDIAKKECQALFDDKQVQLAYFSPDDKYVSFVFENNLYIKELASKNITQITHDGLDRHIINGTTDWVYEEELSITKAYEWSSDSKKIAFMRFDESEVKEFNMLMWDELYPSEHRFKYPKAGEDNSKVDVLVYDLQSKKTETLETGSENDQYIPRIYWVPESQNLIIMIMNRVQNHYELVEYNMLNGSKRAVYSESNERWLDVPEIFFSNKGEYIVLDSEKSKFKHLHLIDLKSGEEKQLTSGDWDIDEVVSYDDTKGVVYFTAYMDNALETVLASVNYKGNIKRLSSKKGTNSAIFSKKHSYYFLTHSDSKTPPTTKLMNSKNKEIRTIIDNNRLKKSIEEYDISHKEFFSFKTSEDVELNAWMIKPQNFDKNKKHPVLMYVYGGPGSKQVENRWDYFDFFWYQVLASKGYIVVCIDNRGTGGRGEDFKKVVYKELGKYETIDQIEGAKYLASLPYVDESRIGIWGWSYGGYMSTLCITKGADEFKTAIAVAPVTTWRYYDNIYTERYMRRPQENAQGYDDNSPINHVKKLKGNYLIVHGSADDNVHYQNAMMLINSLVNANKQFEMFIYPNRNHSIVGGYTRNHLFEMLTDYIERKL
ncbi:MAG: S9 family peptidase [Bacteroidales bacterium]|jgi:dipeptidyl-peptidase-4|nr:S9 family peptidase [Bacteroidales bacterium]